MKLSNVAKKYAQALMGSAGENLNSSLDELKAVSHSFETNEQLKAFFKNASITAAEKKAMLQKAIEGMSPISTGFLMTLIDNGRLSSLSDVIMATQVAVDTKNGIKRGTVKTAYVIADQEKARITEMVKNFVGSKVELSFSLDSSVVGGAVVNVGGWTIDDTVTGQLNKLKENLNRSAN